MEIKKHPQISYNILSSVNDYGPLADMVLSHHKRWDGKGYPSGLTGEEIPLESRIIALADAFDAMTSDRPYRMGINKVEALEIIASEAGKQFDPNIVKIFLEKVMT
ncbi:MAG: HD domain-containing protein [Dethiosulfatibacter sp.]|nr:HD domain-containing protein [Dethiosulfatibacter sp.]